MLRTCVGLFWHCTRSLLTLLFRTDVTHLWVRVLCTCVHTHTYALTGMRWMKANCMCVYTHALNSACVCTRSMCVCTQAQHARTHVRIIGYYWILRLSMCCVCVCVCVCSVSLSMSHTRTHTHTSNTHSCVSIYIHISPSTKILCLRSIHHKHISNTLATH